MLIYLHMALTEVGRILLQTACHTDPLGELFHVVLFLDLRAIYIFVHLPGLYLQLYWSVT